jgi:hypothetical protein
MTTAGSLFDAVREAWAPVPAPPAEDLKFMEWGWGEDAERAFLGVAPVDVDITSSGFFAANPLFDLPPRAAAAYLGTYLMSLLRTLERQKAIGIYSDLVTRAHTLTVLGSERFWRDVIRPFLSPQAREVLAEVVSLFASEREALALTDEQADAMVALAAES